MPGVPGGTVAAAQALSLLFSAAFLTYWAAILVAYLRRRPTEPGHPGAFEWHLVVPCLDEAAVIGDTLAYLRSTFPAAHVWVIDDDSADATAAIAEAVAATDQMVRVIRRRPPDAQVGKGPALNSAYRELRAWLPPGTDLGKVIVGVVDADGRPSPNCLAACAGPDFFGDPKVGGVQVEVRIANRVDRRPLAGRGRLANAAARTLVRMQDVEFRSVIGAIQTSRGRTRTVGMGGNGQFTRLAALASLDDGDGRAWRGSLLEDYELGVHLMLAGHLTAFCADAWVDQEGLPSLQRYLTQRTRWGQGVMQCLRYLPKAWNSRNLTTAGAIETSYYLLQPWLSLLGTIVFPLPVLAMLVNQLHAGTDFVTFLRNGGWVMAVMYLILGTTPFWLWGPLYRRRCEPEAGRLTALGWGFAYLIYVYGFYVTSWRAVIRLARGQRTWSKTRRNAEFEPGAIPALPIRRVPALPVRPVPALLEGAALRPRQPGLGTATLEAAIGGRDTSSIVPQCRRRPVAAVANHPAIADWPTISRGFAPRTRVLRPGAPLLAAATRIRCRKTSRRQSRSTLHELARPPPATNSVRSRCRRRRPTVRVPRSALVSDSPQPPSLCRCGATAPPAGGWASGLCRSRPRHPTVSPEGGQPARTPGSTKNHPGQEIGALRW